MSGDKKQDVGVVSTNPLNRQRILGEEQTNKVAYGTSKSRTADKRAIDNNMDLGTTANPMMSGIQNILEFAAIPVNANATSSAKIPPARNAPRQFTYSEQQQS